MDLQNLSAILSLMNKNNTNQNYDNINDIIQKINSNNSQKNTKVNNQNIFYPDEIFTQNHNSSINQNYDNYSKNDVFSQKNTQKTQNYMENNQNNNNYQNLFNMLSSMQNSPIVSLLQNQSTKKRTKKEPILENKEIDSYVKIKDYHSNKE